MKDCYCHTCDKKFNHLGISAHRAAHRNRNENCIITYSDGTKKFHSFQKCSEGGSEHESLGCL